MAQQDLLLSPERGLCYPEVELLEKLGAPSIGVLPIVVDGVLVGCLYCDRLAPGPDPDPRILELVSRLRCLAARAISIKKPSSV